MKSLCVPEKCYVVVKNCSSVISSFQIDIWLKLNLITVPSPKGSHLIICSDTCCCGRWNNMAVGNWIRSTECAKHLRKGKDEAVDKHWGMK